MVVGSSKFVDPKDPVGRRYTMIEGWRRLNKIILHFLPIRVYSIQGLLLKYTKNILNPRFPNLSESFLIKFSPWRPTLSKNINNRK